MVLEIKNIAGQVQGSLTLNKEFFDDKENHFTIYEGLKNQLANKRQGTASTKTRSFVKASTKKPWKQKGTGRARVGAVSSPLWRGGGVTFGPRPRDYSYRVPKKVKRRAFTSILSLFAKNKKLTVLEDFEMKAYSTKKIEGVLKTITKQEKVLFILTSEKGGSYSIIRKSSSNLSWVKVINQESIELKDLFYAKEVVILKSAIEKINERFLSKKGQK